MPLYPSKKRQKEDEDHELNITSLMDTFTIILVFLIKQYGSSVVDVASGYHPPISKSRIEVSRVMTLQVRNAGRDAIAYRIGEHPEKFERKDAQLGYQQLRADLKSEKKLVDAALTDEKLKGAVNIIADRRLRYGTLMEVMKSTAGAGFFKLKLVAEP